MTNTALQGDHWGGGCVSHTHTHTHTHTAGGPARGTLCVGRGEERLGDRTVPKAEFLGFILEKSLDNLGLYSGSYSSVLY